MVNIDFSYALNISFTHSMFIFSVIPQYISLTNACLVNSMLGTGLFIHTRPHLASASPKDKVIFW